MLLRRLWAAYVTPGRPGRPTPQLELRWIYTAWLGAFDSVGYLPPWNWAWVIPVTAGFGLVWAAADTLARSAWLARWQVTDEPAETTRLARRPTRRPPAREPGEDCRMT